MTVARLGVLRVAAAFAVALAALAPAQATENDLRTVSGMISHNAVLLVFAPALGDPRLAQQRRSFAQMGDVAATRDLVLVQVADGKVIGAHDPSDKLRRQFNVNENEYRAMLIAKSGQVIIDQTGPIAEPALAAAIGGQPVR